MPDAIEYIVGADRTNPNDRTSEERTHNAADMNHLLPSIVHNNALLVLPATGAELVCSM